ncbi:DNA-directed RNA polymerase [Bertholletia excelsa]
MEFCPTCGMLLQYELPHMNRPARLFCPTCPYVSHIESKVKLKRRAQLVRKEIEPIFSEDDMENAPTTEATCPDPDCSFGKAAFQEFQTRSADEPASRFYKCLKCGHTWRED